MATQLAKSKNDLPQTLWSLAETDNVHELESVLLNCIDINTKNAHGTTALMVAAANGRLRMVRALLAHGADPNSSRNDKFTPLLLAAFFGHEQIVKTLVDYGADTNAATRSGTSAKMWASSRTFAEVVAYLNKAHIKVCPDNVQQNSNLDQLSNAEPSNVVTEPIRVAVKQPAAQSVPETSIQTQEYVPTLWSRFSELLHRNVAVYPVVTLVVVAGVIVALSIRQKLFPGPASAQTSQPVQVKPADSRVSATIGTKNEQPYVFSTKASTPASAAATIPVVSEPGINKVSSSNDPIKDSPKNKTKTEPRVITGSDFVPSRQAIQNDAQPLTVPSPSLTDAQKSEATTVKTTPPKPQVADSPQPTAPKRSAPLSSELIAPAKNPAPKGKVIQWP